MADPELDAAFIFCIAEDREGQIWVGTGDGLRCLDSNFRPKVIPRLEEEVRALLVDDHDILWIGMGGHGVGRFRDGAYEFLQRTDGLGSDYVNALAEDREGSLWIGTRGGVSQLTDVKFPTQPAAQDPLVRDALAVCASRQGGIWIGSRRGVTYFDPASRMRTTYGLETGIPDRYIKRVYEAGNGDLCLVCLMKTLAILSPETKLLAVYTNSDLIVGMAEDARGVVVSAGGELYRVGTNSLQPYAFTNGEKPPMYWILNLASGRDGVIWVASAGGIFRVKDGAYKQWAAAEGLSTPVLWICEDNEGVVWGATLRGVVRLKDNRISFIDRKYGLFDDNIYAVVPDDFGNLWVDSGRGIFSVSRQNVSDFAAGKTGRVACTVFNGMDSVKLADKTTQQERVACKTSDGRIWFPSANGVVMIDPAHIPINQVVPPVHIDLVKADGQSMARGEASTVPPGKGDLEFHFDASTFIAPQKARFRYRLEGYDKDWVDADDRRLAFYTNLKPGPYTFHVIAANADGVWNEHGDTIAISLRPHYYQTGWFDLLYGMLALAALGGSYAWRVRHLVHNQQVLQEKRDLLESEVQKRTAELAKSNAALQEEIAEHKRTEDKLKLFRALIEGTNDSIHVVDPATGRFLDVNESACRALGYTRDEHLALTVFDVVEIGREAFHATLAQAKNTGHATVEVLHRRKDGTKFPVEVSLSPVTIDREYLLAVVRDITERKQAEEALKYERDLLRALLDNSPDSIYFKDLESRLVKVSRSEIRNMHHVAVSRYREAHPPEDDDNLPPHLASLESFHEWAIGKTEAEFYGNERAAVFQQDEREIIRTGQPMIGKIERMICPDGSHNWHMTTKVPWRDQDGNIIGTFGTSRNISDLKAAEAEAEEAHKRLLEISRLAGMAEVATNILHNVGNVLNSVNVSAALVTDQLKKSQVSYLGKVAELLNEHAGDLAAFVATDKGRQLPGFLAHLAQCLASEQENAVQELESLRDNIEHINDIVAMQQNYAKIAGVTETVKVTELVEHALRMNAGALVRHDVQIIREFADVPMVTLEKHRVLQILVNLIRNAKYACDDSGREDKQVKVQVTHTGDRVRIALIDNGVGIPAENLSRIFNHGFTTRKGGHGFGLHSGALAAAELGGSLTVRSDGLGRGATFILELPINGASAEDSAHI